MLTDQQLAKLIQDLTDGISEPISHDEFVDGSIKSYNDCIPTKPLGYYDCPICKNKGTVAYKTLDGEVGYRECECIKLRANIRRLQKSGLEDLFKRYSFETFQAPQEWQRKAKETCESYASDPKGWLVISGTPGTGKTHLCTAVCKELIEKGFDVRYFQWRAESPALKAAANTEEYEAKTFPFKNTKVLYIDDFWKGRVTEADVNLAFDILNARYNQTDKYTIISSELSLSKMCDVDQAIGSRIYERKFAYIDTIGKQNWRLR